MYDEVVISPLDYEDSPIIENGQIIQLKGSETEKKRKEEFDIMQTKIAQSNYIIVNVIEENGQKTFVIHSPKDKDYADAPYNPENGDKKFATMEEAKKYISSLK